MVRGAVPPAVIVAFLAAGTAHAGTYRFRGRPGRYPVRLRIRRANTFPFELGYSPTTTVRVR